MRKTLVSYLLITLACAVYALAFNWCFAGSSVNVGGFTGLAQIIHFFLPQVPVGVMTLVLNVPLFLLSWRRFGYRLLAASLYATAISAVMIDVLGSLHTFTPMEPILAALYGGVLMGVACGVMMLQGATTGGTEMAARLLKLHFERLSIGRLCLAIDVAVTATYALVFRDVSRALYGLIALFLLSFVLDRVVYGGNAAKVAYIISEKHEDITAALLALDRGVTLLDGTGAFSGKERKVILCAFGRSQIVPVKKLVQSCDPDAFVIVCDAHEILGEGFGTYTPGGL